MPRVKLTPLKRAALYFLLLYLLTMIGLLGYKFIQVVRS